MSNFQYKARPQEAWDKRAKGSVYDGYASDEFQTFSTKKQNWIRILPPTWDNPQHYGMDLYVHFSVGPNNATPICLSRMKNQPCPVCEAQARAEAAGREDAKDLRPTRRVLVWLLDRSEEKQPLLWAMPWTVDRDISKICKDRMTGQLYFIDDPAAGFDVYFDKEGEGQHTKYTGFAIARQSTPVADKHIEYIIKNPLPKVLIWRTYQEVQALFEGQAVVTDATEQAPAPAPATAPQYTTQLSSVGPTPAVAPVAPFVPQWLNTHCSVCGQLQFTTQSGHTCAQGHGGAPSQEELAPPPPPPAPVAVAPPPMPQPQPVAAPVPPQGPQPVPITSAPPAAPAPAPATAGRTQSLRDRFQTGAR